MEAHLWEVISHRSHWSTLIFRVSVLIRARLWLVSSPADKTSFCGFGFNHWTARNFTEPRGLFNKQLQQDLVYNNTNNFVQQQFRGGTTHPHGRDCFYCWFFIVGIVEIYIPLSARCVVASGGVPDEPRGRMGCFARVVGFMLLLLPYPVFSWDSLDFYERSEQGG